MPTVLDSLNAALRRALATDERVYLLGEDILDPYGGAFKVTRGLSSDFPGRVITTPVSEAGMVGLATGMALRGLRPVVEIMFGDFVTLIADPLVNGAAKFRWMYNDQARVPLVIRTPMGGRRGYGPTHSQTLEKLYLGLPGLRVLAPCAFGDPGQLLFEAILEQDDPVLFVENKLLYLQSVREAAAQDDFQAVPANEPAFHEDPRQDDRLGQPLSPGSTAPTYRLSLRGAPAPMLTLAAYGYMAELARQAALRLAYEHELFVELIVPTQLAPFRMGTMLESARRTSRLLVIEEGNQTMGWGAEIVARAAETLGPGLHCARRLGGRDLPIPAAVSLESAVLPNVDEIVQTARGMR